jgi:DNA invertase Pin-like site-specific DNA recombinase
VQEAVLVDVLIDAGESAKSPHRPGMARLLAMVDARAVDVVIIAKLDRLTRSVARIWPSSSSGSGGRLARTLSHQITTECF